MPIREEEPFSEAYALREARRLLSDGTIRLSRHVQERMAERGMGLLDVENVIRRGRCPPGRYLEAVGSRFRYRVETSKMAVVFAFGGPERLVICTAFRMDS